MDYLLLEKNKPAETDEHGHGESEAHAEGHEHKEGAEQAGKEGEHEAEGHAEVISLTAQQIAEQGVQLANVELGAVTKSASYPAKLMVNTDRQAHVSPAFSGHVQSVSVELDSK